MVKGLTLNMTAVIKNTLHNSMHNVCVPFARFMKSMAPISTSAYICVPCVYVCVYVSVCMLACIRAHACMHASTCVCECVSVCKCVCARKHACKYACKYV